MIGRTPARALCCPAGVPVSAGPAPSEQGYACDKALSAKREHSELDDAVWILKCDNPNYRVRLIPAMAAKVERLD